tara:strand:- start:1751 stop:1954 length:204 start_codon:yes stop_codon:yes gene_type:complete
MKRYNVCVPLYHIHCDHGGGSELLQQQFVCTLQVSPFLLQNFCDFFPGSIDTFYIQIGIQASHFSAV